MVANMVALGAVAQLSKLVTTKNLEKALSTRIPPGTKEMNMRALREGIKAARNYDLKSLPRTIVQEEVEL
jgi:2-oxoglutarate ferredoxin oxidoreductase subunit gamma